MLVNDSDDIVRESECPVCRRLFCAQCYVPWHCGVQCEEFQKMNVDERSREDLMVKELAKAKQWTRCPYCRFFVEKTEGCLHMTCRSSGSSSGYYTSVRSPLIQPTFPNINSTVSDLLKSLSKLKSRQILRYYADMASKSHQLLE
ncbi:hypothetical protein MTR67_028592 [Solanum verrucosum]|uniref:RING-type domain-containing protein n=1 Tax=Solanum verrucosum TaxID=315347 RepID=A0AAF0R7G7_SOLVR|nr:hypothetical protein MTR67_028592 [Solanum verrucosum]